MNVSAHQLMAADFAASVEAILIGTDTDPTQVTLEVTESVFLHDVDGVLNMLKDLRRLGVKLAIDDFGTGYSSLSYLKRLPVDVLKIDRSFIADLDRDRTSRLIVRAIVQLAHELGMVVVAEGVESAEQHEQVALLGCDSFQGYYFARPAPADDVEASLSART